jgi:hypothetical protein
MQRWVLRTWATVAAIAAAAILSVRADEVRPGAPQADVYSQRVRPLLSKYCFECHRGAKAQGDLQLDKYPTAASVLADDETWQRVRHMLEVKEMPPDKAPKPTEAQRKIIVDWIASSLQSTVQSGPPNPGRVTARRLNRIEYANTIRDLLGVQFDTTADFPADDVGYGFDNIGDVLTLPPVLFEKYLAAAEKISARAMHESRDRILFVKPSDERHEAETAKKIIRRLATRAYRRRPTDRELGRLMRLDIGARRQGESFEGGIQFALKAILVSPNFLYRIEVDPSPAGKNEVRRLNDFELASRLSYFLWSSMPDDELFQLAIRSDLHSNLAAQVNRMIRDPKSRALAENFAGQWLQFRKLARVSPSPQEFPAFDDAMRTAMRTESEMFFAAVLHEDRSILDFVNADFTFLNERLAKLYGISGVHGDQFRRVELRKAASEGARVRGGVITQASMLTVTSNPTRTSPVKRGKWIMENILGTPPPDPPASVPPLKDDAGAVASGSLRERMERHRRDPQCAVCHREMDALGFALQNFDAVGAWRTRDGSFAIDPSGELPDGRKFNGAADLKNLLRGSDKQKFARCLTEKMLTYALGRGLEPFDRPAVDHIVQSLSAADYKFSALVQGIVQSDPFQKRLEQKVE